MRDPYALAKSLGLRVTREPTKPEGLLLGWAIYRGDEKLWFSHDADRCCVALVRLGKPREMTAAEREEQRRSFAYGNVALSNPSVTRELVDAVADEMASARSTEPAVEGAVGDAGEG